MIFQRELENRVTRIPYVKVHSDDILISGENDKEHLENLKQILRIIQANRLPFKLGKCVCVMMMMMMMMMMMNCFCGMVDRRKA